VKHSFSTTGALFSALLTAWYVAAEPEPGATPSFVVHDIAIVRDALGLPHFVPISVETPIEPEAPAPPRER
jgi:hypothetical protein